MLLRIHPFVDWSCFLSIDGYDVRVDSRILSEVIQGGRGGVNTIDCNLQRERRGGGGGRRLY